MINSIDCSCKGINSLCEKCYGRGYYDIHFVLNSRFFFNYQEKKTTLISPPSTFKQLDSYKELKSLSIKLIVLIDSKSKEQTSIIAVISSTKPILALSKKSKYELTRKYDRISQLENDKIFLKSKLNQVCQNAKLLGFNIEIKYNNYFSKKNYRS